LAHGVFRSGGGKIEGGDRFYGPVNPLFYQTAPSKSLFMPFAAIFLLVEAKTNSVSASCGGGTFYNA